MATELEIYDFETAIEGAVKSLFTAAEIEVLTRQNSQTEMQQVRPRVEIQFQCGPETETFNFLTSTRKRNAAWTGSLVLAVVTNITEDGGAHRQFRAKVRSLCAEINQFLRESELLENHAINRCVCTGSTIQAIRDGAEVSNLEFNIHFNIRSDRWPDDL